VLKANAKPVGSRRYRVDLIGVTALLVAGVGLASALTLFSMQSGDSTTRDSGGARTVSAVPMRDQWYLDAPASSSVPSLSEQPRDRWYLDAPASSSVPNLSEQPRDRWYLDGR
jgi:hypothetical protein